MFRSALTLAALLSGAALRAQSPSVSMDTEARLLERIRALEQRLAALEARLPEAQPAPALASPPAPPPAPAAVSDAAVLAAPATLPDYLNGTTFNLYLDGYYGYNFNRPAGRINLLRAYDVLSNSFSLNQAAVLIERAPEPAAGRRFGIRLDLQYGQATETLQGNAANEPRPQVYRPVFQAYGTYVLPVGTGLTVDFGKWASALGIENNYTKDQMNYSRSYFFNFLPFYHFGFRTSYSPAKWLNVNYWLVNGVQQSEDFNGFKSQAVLFTFKPAGAVSWNVNYFTGIENRDVNPALNPGLPELPTQPGLSANVIGHVGGRRLHILDSYATWDVNRNLTLAAEGDYVTHRGGSPSPRVAGGAAYARYRFTRKLAGAFRGEYLSDRGGLFSGTTQALKEATVTVDYAVADGFLVRSEWRRDFSNRPFFFTETPGVTKRDQNTATLGLIWWLGGKQGAW